MLLETPRTGSTPMDMTRLAGKTAVVTGGAAGIGLALAKRLKAEGMRIVLVDKDQAALDQAAAELGATAFAADIRDADGMRTLARRVADEIGPVHLLCANAGVAYMAGIDRLTPLDWRWLFEVNMFGAVNTVTAFLPALKANPDGGHVLITASLSSLYATRAQAAYAATKYALAAFGETLALELDGEGAKAGVSLLCPGPVRTDLGTSYAKREAEYVAPAAAEGADVHLQAFWDEVNPEDYRTPEQVAEAAFRGMRRGELWIITHPEMMGPAEGRARALSEAARRAAADGDVPA